MADGPRFVRGEVVGEDGGRAVVDFPEQNWGPSRPMVLSALVAGEACETRAVGPPSWTGPGGRWTSVPRA